MRNLVSKGVDIYYNDEIERFLGDRTVTGIRLKSGLTDRMPGNSYCNWYCAEY